MRYNDILRLCAYGEKKLILLYAAKTHKKFLEQSFFAFQSALLGFKLFFCIIEYFRRNKALDRMLSM